MAQTRTGGWIQTFSGGRFFPLDPRSWEVRIEDVAHALSLLCRFGGHARSFYSVAEHSVRVSQACAPADAFWGLLHDASEAYLVDLPRPLKRLPELAGYLEAERRVMEAVCVRFGLPSAEPQGLRHADDLLLATERRDLMAPSDADWGPLPEPLPERIEPWPATHAEELFLARFSQLCGETWHNR